MTTDYRGTTIRHTYSDLDALNDGVPTTEALDRLSQQIADALADAYPGAKIEVDYRPRTSGYSRTTATGPDTIDPIDIEDEVSRIANEAWARWCEGLNGADIMEQ
jgi:hypothetical protein